MATTAPSDIGELIRSLPKRALLGGEWIDTDATLAVQDPATGRDLTEVADLDSSVFLDALDRADSARESLAAWPTRERAEFLRRVFELVQQNAEKLATVMTLEMGKPLVESRGEVAYGNEFVRWFSEEAARIGGDYRPAPSGTGRILVTPRPVGPCLLITPWNFPLAMATRKIAPALAAGCPVILKPASATPLTALLFAELLVEAGVPDGAVSVLPTSTSGDSTAPVIADPRLRKLSFTGSTSVGRGLMRDAADQILRVSMELGGNAPFLVFADADLDAAVDGAHLAKMRNGGQACTSANRILVHESIAADFSRRLGDRIDAMSVGSGLDDGVDLGPVITEAARDGIEEKVNGAVEAGAEIIAGGGRASGSGWFLEPAVLTDVPADTDLWREEIFGPIASIATFTDEDEAIARANETPYGLVAYAYTTDLDRALRLGDRLEFGMVGINRGIVSDPAAPFGGRKRSGVGREGGRTGIDEYLEPVYLALP